MMATKLNERQLGVLKQMAEGQRLEYCQGTRGGGWYWLVDRTKPRSPTTKVLGGTVEALRKRGLIKALPYVMGSFETVYRLTDAGRKAVEEVADGQGQE